MIYLTGRSASRSSRSAWGKDSDDKVSSRIEGDVARMVDKRAKDMHRERGKGGLGTIELSSHMFVALS